MAGQLYSITLPTQPVVWGNTVSFLGASLYSKARHAVQALMSLRETNEAAFFGLMAQDVTGLLPLVYTPTVGVACQNWSRLLPRPTGLYISRNDQVCGFAIIWH